MSRTLIDLASKWIAGFRPATVIGSSASAGRHIPAAAITLLIPLLALTSMQVQAAISCPADTTQSDFQQGTLNQVVVGSGGDVSLASSGAVDQQNTSLTVNGFQFHSYWWFAQSFTAGVSGPMTSVDLRLFCSGCTGTTPDITVAIRATSGGIPTGGDLATATIPGFSSGTGKWYNAAFGSPIQMSAGTKYAIIVKANANNSAGYYAYLVSADDNAYTGGQRLTSTNSGQSFEPRTYDVGFKVYSGAGHVAAGDLVSSLKDSNPPVGSNPTWSDLSWSGNSPASTSLRFQAAASNSSSGPFNFVGPDGTANSFFNSATANLSQFDGLRYLKYKSLLASTDSSKTPTLNEVSVCYDHATLGADLQISKTNYVTTSTAGAPTSYTIVASNAGPSAVIGATVTDTFNSNLQNCSWTCSGLSGGSCTASGSGNISQAVNLPVGASVTFIAQCQIAPSTSGSLVNTATISATQADPVSGNNSATDSDTLVASANLGITKTNNVTTSTPGQPTTYTIVASNAGPSHVGSATVSDTFDSSLQNCSWTCSGSGGASCGAGSGNGNINQNVVLPVNGSVSYSATCAIAASATGSLVNTASVSSAITDGATGNNSATDTDTLAGSADLAISKTNNVTTSTPGAPTTYTIVASNAGPSAVSSATVSDTFHSNLQNCSWTCSSAGGASCGTASGSGNINRSVNLPVGGSVTYSASCTISASATGSLANTASISSSLSDPVSGNNSATDTDTLAASANLGITKTNNVTTSTPGQPTTYTIVASNAGPSAVSSATVTDTFHSNLQNCNWTCSGSGGASCAAASGNGNISQSVVLPVNGSVSYSASCTISASATGNLVNAASISSAITDPTPGNNSVTDTDTLAASANLGITKTNNTSTSTPGQPTTYTIVASNAGPSAVSSATVSDTFHSWLQNCSWTCSSAGGASCGTASGTGSINRSVNLPVGGSVTYSASCTVASSATGSLVNTATVSSSINDPVSGNNSATDTDTLPGSADLSINLSNEESVVIAGSSVIYTIVAANAGPSPVSNATVTDNFSSKLENCEWVCQASAGASCGTSSGVGNINQSVNLQSGANVTFTAICDVDDGASGSLVNTATIGSSITDPVPANNSATETDTLNHMADLSISMSDGVSSTKPGSSVTYSIVASNAGSSTVSQVNIKDNFPASLSSCSWTCQGSSGGNCPASGSGHINHTVTLPRGAQVAYSATCNVSTNASGMVVNVAEVSSAINDPDMNNNEATDVNSLQDEVIFKSSFD